MGARKQFTPEFKREAVQLLASGSHPASGLARELAGDLTFVPTRTGWLTVAVLLGLYSRRVVGGP